MSTTKYQPRRAPAGCCGMKHDPLKTYGPEHEDTPIYEGWTVDHGWSGIVHGPETEVRWRVEIVRDKALADRIWAARKAISALVAAHGGDARLDITPIGDGDLQITEYDGRRWTDCVAG